jgi:hypothetical protein
MKFRNIRNWVVSLAIVASAGGALLTTAMPQIVMAASDNCNQGFLGFPSWFRGLTAAPPDCSIESPTKAGGISKFIWHIVLNIVEMALVAVGYISAFYILYGGFQFMTSQGKPDNAAKARSIILDAIIGLIISFAAVAVVNFVVDGVLK